MEFPCGESEAERIMGYAEAVRAQSGKSVVVVGIQGVQGVGKSHLCSLLTKAHSGSTALSIDDFYYGRGTMAMDAVRGWPGTHDVEWLSRCVDDLRRRAPAVRVPVYDKGARAGQGDRTGVRTITGRPSIVFVEGWCLGFSPRGIDDELDRRVREYENMLTPRLDGFVVLHAPAAAAYAWRERAEATMRRKNHGEAMSTTQVARFVDHYMPVYKRYLERLQASDPTSNTLHLHLDVASDFRCLPKGSTLNLSG